MYIITSLIKKSHCVSGLKTAFDEKTLFPKYILDYEAKMKAYHKMAIEGTSVRNDLVWIPLY